MSVINDPLGLMLGDDYVVNDRLTVKCPTLRQVQEYGEQDFWITISTLCSTSADFKVVLYDSFHVYWTEITEFDWFAVICKQLSLNQTSILLGDIDLTHTNLYQDTEYCKILKDEISGNVLLTEAEYFKMVEYLRKTYRLNKNEVRQSSQEAKDYIIKRERRKAELHANEKFESILAPMVSTLANTGVGYTYQTIADLSMSQFMDAIGRIQKIKTYDNLMHGAYSGVLDLDKVNKDDLNYMGRL